MYQTCINFKCKHVSWKIILILILLHAYWSHAILLALNLTRYIDVLLYYAQIVGGLWRHEFATYGYKLTIHFQICYFVTSLSAKFSRVFIKRDHYFDRAGKESFTVAYRIRIKNLVKLHSNVRPYIKVMISLFKSIV